MGQICFFVLFNFVKGRKIPKYKHHLIITALIKKMLRTVFTKKKKTECRMNKFG